MKYPEDYVNKILCGDCLDLMKGIPDKAVDLVLTDPPYGIGISSNPFRQAHVKTDWDNKRCSQESIWQMMRVSKEQVIWGGNYFDMPPTQCFYIWDKEQPQDFSSAMCEFAWVSRQSPAKIFKKRVTEYKKVHPTQKPDALMIWILEQFPDAKTVLDPFLGSGTVAVACKELKRDYIGIEISDKYCEIAQRRLAQEYLFT